MLQGTAARAGTPMGSLQLKEGLRAFPSQAFNDADKVAKFRSDCAPFALRYVRRHSFPDVEVLGL